MYTLNLHFNKRGWFFIWIDPYNFPLLTFVVLHREAARSKKLGYLISWTIFISKYVLQKSLVSFHLKISPMPKWLQIHRIPFISDRTISLADHNRLLSGFLPRPRSFGVPAPHERIFRKYFAADVLCLRGTPPSARNIAVGSYYCASIPASLGRLKEVCGFRVEAGLARCSTFDQVRC